MYFPFDNGSSVKYESIAEIVRDIEARPIESGGQLYHPIPFDEFSHFTTSTTPTEVARKWGLIGHILDSLYPAGIAGLELLDIGANGGFYTFSAAQRGMRVTAFEPHPRYSAIGEVIAREKGVPVAWHPLAFTPSLVAGRRFDCAFMFSVFQWMAAGGQRLSEACEELRYISETTDHLFFELGFNAGQSCLTTTKRNHYGVLIEMLRNNTGYTSFKHLGTIRLWRGQARYLVLCSNHKSWNDSLGYLIWRNLPL
jgi:hypothetical protein